MEEFGSFCRKPFMTEATKHKDMCTLPLSGLICWHGPFLNGKVDENFFRERLGRLFVLETMCASPVYFRKVMTR